MSNEFKYEIDENYDYTIDEKGNSFIALRKIKWGSSEDYKLDLRKYYTSAEGERMNKGVSFLTEDGPNELTRVLLETGYGEPDEIIDTIKNNRPDILSSLEKLVNNSSEENDETSDDEYYDPREAIL